MTDSWEFDTGQLRGFAVDLTRAADQVLARGFQLVHRHGARMKSRVQANASGRPGPRAVTGDYRRSISQRTTRLRGEIVGEVGTNRPQGRRLEFGFHGTDSLGRRFAQPPYAHFGPALDATVPEFMADVADLGEGLLDDGS